jgi:hypothetical protein
MKVIKSIIYDDAVCPGLCLPTFTTRNKLEAYVSEEYQRYIIANFGDHVCVAVMDDAGAWCGAMYRHMTGTMLRGVYDYDDNTTIGLFAAKGNFDDDGGALKWVLEQDEEDC